MITHPTESSRCSQKSLSSDRQTQRKIHKRHARHYPQRKDVVEDSLNTHKWHEQLRHFLKYF